MLKNSLHNNGIKWNEVNEIVQYNIEHVFSDKVCDKNSFMHVGMSDFIGDYMVQVRTKEKKEQNRFYNAYNDYNIAVGMLSLAPFNSSGKNLCEHAGICRSICIGYSGESQNVGRIKKSVLFQINPQRFFEILVKNIIGHVNKFRKRKQIPVIRLNGYSDIRWENEYFVYSDKIKEALEGYKLYSYENTCLQHLVSNENIDIDLFMKREITIFDVFPDLLFYDYTKYLHREVPTNYYLTFSYDKGNNELPDNNINITVIVSEILKNELLSSKDKKYIDGDTQDCRLLDYDVKERKIILLAFQQPKEKVNENKYAITSIQEFRELILDHF